MSHSITLYMITFDALLRHHLRFFHMQRGTPAAYHNDIGIIKHDDSVFFYIFLSGNTRNSGKPE